MMDNGRRAGVLSQVRFPEDEADDGEKRDISDTLGGSIAAGERRHENLKRLVRVLHAGHDRIENNGGGGRDCKCARGAAELRCAGFHDLRRSFSDGAGQRDFGSVIYDRAETFDRQSIQSDQQRDPQD